MVSRARSDGRDFVVVGAVAKPHGIKGELCVISHADSPSLFSEVPQIYLRRKNEDPVSYALTKLRMHKGRPLITLKGVDDRNGAEALRGMELVILRSDMPEPDDGQVYLHDIIGFMVVLEDGTELGRFVRFIETPATEVWIVQHPEGEILLPAEEEFILDIDLDQERIVTDPPPGLVDLYLSEEAKPKKKKGRGKRPRPKNST